MRAPALLLLCAVSAVLLAAPRASAAPSNNGTFGGRNVVLFLSDQVGGEILGRGSWGRGGGGRPSSGRRGSGRRRPMRAGVADGQLGCCEARGGGPPRPRRALLLSPPNTHHPTAGARPPGLARRLGRRQPARHGAPQEERPHVQACLHQRRDVHRRARVPVHGLLQSPAQRALRAGAGHALLPLPPGGRASRRWGGERGSLGEAVGCPFSGVLEQDVPPPSNPSAPLAPCALLPPSLLGPRQPHRQLRGGSRGRASADTRRRRASASAGSGFPNPTRAPLAPPLLPKVNTPVNIKGLASAAKDAGYSVVYKGKMHLSKPINPDYTWSSADAEKYGWTR
jgi:hypothetical protein